MEMDFPMNQVAPLLQQIATLKWLGRPVKVTLQDGTVLMGVFQAVKPLVHVQLRDCFQHVAGSTMYLEDVTVAMQNVLSIDVD